MLFPAVFKALLTAVAVLLLAVVTGAWAPREAQAPSETPPALLDATPAEIPSTTSPEATKVSDSEATTPEKPAVAEKTKTTPAPKAAPAPVAAPPVQAIVETIAETLATTSAPSPLPFTEVVRAATVNIVCVTEAGGPLESISASGVTIDPRGVILTNAHVAQYFLLRNYPTPDFVQCVIRTGSPAYPRYTARLLFMPPSWIAQNAHKINDENPTGNGEHDWAFLLTTGAVDPDTELPGVLPALPTSPAPPSAGEKVLLAAYPAGFLGGITIVQNLYSVSSYVNVGELYTFGSGALDLFSIGGTIVSQKGSSGGAVTDLGGMLVGLIVTATDAPDTASRDLRAIAIPYLTEDFRNESGVPLATFLSGDLAAKADVFALTIAPTLTQTLINAINGR